MSKSPLATYALLAINIAVFVVMVISGVDWMKPATDQVLRWGADYGPSTLNGQYWRLITSMFLHFGIIHIAGNMWCLWSLGQLAERLLGSFTLFGVYILTGIGSSLLSLSWDPMRVSAGASGAIFGIAGVLITTLYFGKLNLPKESVRRLLGYVVRFSFLNLLFGLQGHIDNMAHVGGLVSGIVIGFFLARAFNVPAEERGAQHRTVLAVSAVLLLVLFVPVAKAKQYAIEFDKGKTAFDQKNYQAAMQHMQRYISQRPEDPYGHAVLGASFQQLGRTDEAIREYELGLAIAPDYRYIQISLAELYALQDKPEKALPLFKKNLNEIAGDAESMYYYGNALTQAGDLAAAESALKKSAVLDSKRAAVHLLLAQVLKSEGKTEEAAKEQQIAVSLKSNTSPQTGSDTTAH
ncbi:MAG TPA: rhomboid family intramembrane serine protease [Candidatus Angelobacter sp.]